jgi:hypothetical protein
VILVLSIQVENNVVLLIKITQDVINAKKIQEVLNVVKKIQITQLVILAK